MEIHHPAKRLKMAKDTVNMREYSYTLQTIADVTTQSLNTVRDHKKQGLLKPNDLWNVAKYIQAIKQMQGVKRSKGHEVDEWGEPL